MLDFGDYESDYVTLQTTQGEEISQQIAGYVFLRVKCMCMCINELVYA